MFAAMRGSIQVLHIEYFICVALGVSQSKFVRMARIC